MSEKTYTFDAHEARLQCVAWIRDYFQKTGGKTAVIGISGGKDSTIAAALCVEALGKENVFGVLMPNGKQPDLQDAIDVCEYLRIEYNTFNIHKAAKDIKRIVKDGMNTNWCKNSSINLPPRVRMTILYAISPMVHGRVVNTCNLSEDWVGYATHYGDSAGDFSPLGNFTVTEVKSIGYDMNLPARFIDKTPADGLCGQTDEENLGFTYEEEDLYIRRGIEPSPEKKAKIDELHEKNLFKLELMPRFVYQPEAAND